MSHEHDHRDLPPLRDSGVSRSPRPGESSPPKMGVGETLEFLVRTVGEIKDKLCNVETELLGQEGNREKAMIVRMDRLERTVELLQKIVFGAVGFIVLSVLVAVVALVVKGGGHS